MRWLAALAAVTVAVAGLVAADEPARFVGAEICIDCHSDPTLGNQALVWTGSHHARTFLLLDTGNPAAVPEAARGFVDPGFGRAIRAAAQRLGSETECLQCHGAGARIDPELTEPTFHHEDGVQCEACHGPGSRHVALRRTDPDGGAPHAIDRSSTAVCLTCHRHKPSHEAVLGERIFDVETAWPMIAHPRP